MRQLAQTGHVNQQVVAQAGNVTLIRGQNSATKEGVGKESLLAAVVVVAFAVGGWW